jgi:hypothetical protein
VKLPRSSSNRPRWTVIPGSRDIVAYLCNDITSWSNDGLSETVAVQAAINQDPMGPGKKYRNAKFPGKGVKQGSQRK